MPDVFRRGVERYRERGFISFLIGVKNHIARQIIPLKPRCYSYWLLRQNWLSQTSEGEWYIRPIGRDDRFYFPDLATVRNHTPSRFNRMERIYRLNEIEQGDIVFDVGAYIGRSSIIAAEKAEQVYAIEPSSRNQSCLKKNTERYGNIEILPYAAWNKSEEIELQIGTIAGDDSVIEPDSGRTKKTETVEALTIADIARRHDIDQIDFLKIEAEGVEPEVIEGIGEIEIDTIVCNCGPERYGKPVEDIVRSKLEEKGYKTSLHTDHPASYTVVYARL